MPTKNQKYYAKRKNDPDFMEKLRAYQRNKRATDPEYRAYLKAYAKKYYQEHKKELNEKRKTYPDPTRNARVSKFRKKEMKTLADNYIIRLLTRYGKYTKEEVTPALIRKKRKEIINLRQKRSEAGKGMESKKLKG